MVSRSCLSKAALKFEFSNRMTEIIYERTFDAFLRYDFIYKFSKLYKQELENLKVLHGFTDGVIKRRRDELLNQAATSKFEGESETKTKKALLDVLLQATVDGAPLSNTDIREEVDTFMFEGHDTTTSGISFCLFNIAKHPEVQRKIVNEMDSQIEYKEGLTLQNLSKLHYLDLVIKESLRLFPSVPYYARKVMEEVTIAGHTFPKFANVAVSPFLMGRDATIFPSPLEFRPERFDVETTTEKVNPYAYIPFSAGETHFLLPEASADA